MIDSTKKSSPEFRTSGILIEKAVVIADQSSIDALSSRGYGTLDGKIFLLAFFEALYLQDKGMLEVKNQNEEPVDFQGILHSYERQNQNAWVNYLVYRDLRSRGYVVREGFGVGIDFRIYERGSYGKDIAPYLILVTQEGKPLPINDLAKALEQSSSQKKELILAVMNRRGEVVHYSVGELHLPF